MAATVPVGSVMAYAGDVVDNGSAVRVPSPGSPWLLCNGAALNGLSADYAALYAVLGARHGNGSDGPAGANFNLPDYRGLFLRGVDGPRGLDPDKNARVQNHPGGNVGNLVGSRQLPGTAQPTAGPFKTTSDGAHPVGTALVGTNFARTTMVPTFHAQMAMYSSATFQPIRIPSPAVTTKPVQQTLMSTG
jgi:microcystin-dependent protein